MFRTSGYVPESTEHLVAELDFQLDDFRKQKVLYDAEAYGQMSKRLMLMKKGDFPSDPNMGVGISTYRFQDLDIISGGMLKDEIQQQHSQYIPGLVIEDIIIQTLKYAGGYILYVDIVCLSPVVRQIDHAFLQVNHSLLNAHLKVEKPKVINVPRE